MRKAILFTSIILLATTAFAQHETPDCNQNKNSKEVLPVTIFYYHDEFEESYYYDEYLGYNYDTTGILNYNVLGLDSIWMAGIPNKSVWDTSYLHEQSRPKALLTDTVNPYPPNNHSVMEINVEKPAWTAMYNYCWSLFVLQFDFACDTDTLKDGMYIEISFDGGQSFVNSMNPEAILNANKGPDNIDNFSVSQMSIIGDSVLGYTGNIINNVYEPGLNYPYMESFSLGLWWDDVHGYDVTNAKVRMHFVSDSIDNTRQGIMLDYLSVYVEEWCHYIGIENEKQDTDKPFLYPNPLTRESKIQYNNNSNKLAKLNIYNSTGALIHKTKTYNDHFMIGNKNFKSGIYFYQLIVGDANYTGKFIVK